MALYLNTTEHKMSCYIEKKEEGGEILKWREWGIKGGGRVMRGTSGVMGLALLSHVLIEHCYWQAVPSWGSRFM